MKLESVCPLTTNSSSSLFVFNFDPTETLKELGVNSEPTLLSNFKELFDYLKDGWNTEYQYFDPPAKTLGSMLTGLQFNKDIEITMEQAEAIVKVLFPDTEIQYPIAIFSMDRDDYWGCQFNGGEILHNFLHPYLVDNDA